MQTTTAVPAYTLQAITRQLTDKKGVDITNIVNALAPGRDENVVAVQTALLLNGFKQEATQHSRLQIETSKSRWEPKVAVWRLDYKATAVYDQRVYYGRTLIYVDVSNMNKSEGASYKPGTQIQEDSATYSTWENEFLDFEEFDKEYPDIAASLEMGIEKIEPSNE